MDRSSRWGVFACMLGLMACSSVVSPTCADAGIGGGLEIGLGGMHTAPFVVGAVGCVSLGFEFRAAVPASPLRPRVELRWTAGADVVAKAPEAARGGNQSLSTALVGFELAKANSRGGAFLDAGMGLGHSTISAAHGPTDSPNHGFVGLTDRTAVAYGLGLGYRASRPAHGQIALRTTGLINDLTTSFSLAGVLALGFAF